jgi:histidinol dehydrogenase
VTIVGDVKERGLDAVREWALKLDGVEPARA